jgi:hypothetical protein
MLFRETVTVYFIIRNTQIHSGQNVKFLCVETLVLIPVFIVQVTKLVQFI